MPVGPGDGSRPRDPGSGPSHPAAPLPPVHHPVFARLLAWTGGAAARGFADLRRELLAGASGTAVEVGCGPGSNFPYYPAAVRQVVAVEPEPYLRRAAERAARAAPVPIGVRAGVAEALPLADGSADVAVVSLVLCSVADPGRALAELVRVLRPGGEVLFWEHVRADEPGLARRQARADRWLWPALSGGCHCCRDTGAAMADAGFTVTRLRAFRLSVPAPLAIISPMIVGAARRG